MEKEITNKEDLFVVLDLLEKLNIKYWVEGGWGVDILTGKQNREHRDIDIDFNATFIEELLNALENKGYVITTDWRPSRIELHHSKLGYLDIHPLILNKDGSAKQATPNGRWYEFESTYFSSAIFEGRIIPCISTEAQILFHSGYELREVDHIDLENIRFVLDNKK
jgi:lincosamide nucleotidyltransferase A/C/D/E